MKILDFGAGQELGVGLNWLDNGIIWRALIQKILGNIGLESVGEFDIHCLDTPESALPKEIKRHGHPTIHGHRSIDTVPDNFDVICALNPDPRVMSNPNTYHRELGIVITTKLKIGGVLLVQFDTCFTDETNPGKSTDPSTKDFLYRMSETTQKKMQPVCQTHENQDMFPGVYSKLALHAFIKES